MNEFSSARDVFVSLFEKYQVTFLSLEEREFGLELSFEVFVRPGRKKEAVEKKDGHFLLSLREHPIDNEANHATLRLMASICAVSPSSVKIKSGQHSKRKRLLVHYTFAQHKGLDYYTKKLEETLKLL